MRSRSCRLLRWLLVVLLVCALGLVVALPVAGKLWADWLASQSLQKVEWQGLKLSWSGLELAGFALERSGDGLDLKVQGTGLRLGWRWHDLALAGIRVQRLDLELPDWPERTQGNSGDSGTGLSSTLPAWLPESIHIGELRVSLPEDAGIHGDLSLSLAQDPAQWQVRTEALHIRGQLPEFLYSGWHLQDIRGQVTLSGRAGLTSAELRLLPESVLTVERIDHPGPEGMPALDQASADLGGLDIRAEYRADTPELHQVTFAGPISLEVGALHHGSLKTLGWWFRGSAKGSLDGVAVNGQMTASSGLSSDLALGWRAPDLVWLDGGLQMDGARAGKALSATLAHWPEMLQLDAGTLTLGAHLYHSDGNLLADASLGVKGLSGVLDRTAWSGLDGRLDVSFGDTLVARTWDLQLASLNPGMEIGPVTVSASYEAPALSPEAGIFTLTEGRAGLFGGEAWVRPGQWPVTLRPVQLQVELNSVQLDKLLEAYPAEGVSARGTLEGSLPVQLGPEGVQIQGGAIQALAPGGVLRLPAEQLQGIMGNSVEVAPVVQALQNFNYTALASTIDYDLNGKLVMGLSVQGRNPEVQDGRPIVLNIQLEEDIPALLTSLQLSGRVNEAVTEKVRKMMNRGESGQPGH